MISSLSFLELRSCAGDSVSFLSLFWMSRSCRRRSLLKTSAMLSKVSSTFGLSSASIAASDIEFSRSSSSMIGFGERGFADLPRRHRRRWSRCGLTAWLPAAPNGGARPAAAGRAARSPARRGAAAPSPAGQPAALLGIGAGIGGFQIDDVAQENLALVELVAPDDEGLEGQRAFAQAGDHRLAAGLDALGDGDFAFAREQLDRAHFAQIHAHRIVGALGRLLGFGFGRRSSA